MERCCVEAALPGPSMLADDERLAALCKALAHPHRVTILRFLLAQRACLAGELVDLLPIAASTVSEHLRVLRAAGLVKGEVDGPRRCYCVDPEGVAALRGLVGGLTGGQP